MCRLQKAVCLVFGLLFTVAVFSAAAAAQDLPEIQSQGEVSYVSGGVGEEERAWLDELSDRFNLKITMAQQEGNYLSDIRVRIYNQQAELVLDAVSDGPWFFAELPAGAYTIDAEAAGRTIIKKVNVTATEQSEVVFAW